MVIQTAMFGKISNWLCLGSSIPSSNWLHWSCFPTGSRIHKKTMKSLWRLGGNPSFAQKNHFIWELHVSVSLSGKISLLLRSTAASAPVQTRPRPGPKLAVDLPFTGIAALTQKNPILLAIHFWHGGKCTPKITAKIFWVFFDEKSVNRTGGQKNQKQRFSVRNLRRVYFLNLGMTMSEILHYPHAPCIVYLPTFGWFWGKCWYIVHRWSIWVIVTTQTDRNVIYYLF